MIKFKNPIKMSKIGKMMNLPIPLVMRIIILFDWRMNLLNVSLGTKILILNSIRGQIIFDFHWFMKDKEAIDWKEGFPQLPLDKETKLKGGHGKLG
jgi:hypothetical protein